MSHHLNAVAMKDALLVLTQTPHIRNYLEQNDPKALQQALQSLAPPVSKVSWRLTPAGELVASIDGQDAGNVWRTRHGCHWIAFPWGHQEIVFETQAEAKAYVEEKLAC